MTTAELQWWRSKGEQAGQRYGRFRLEMDQAAKAGDWDRVRALAKECAREASAGSEAHWALKNSGWSR